MKAILFIMLIGLSAALAVQEQGLNLPALDISGLAEPLAAAAVPATAPVVESVSIVPTPTALLGQEAACTRPSCRAAGPTGRLSTKRAKKQKKNKLEIALSAIKQDILVRDRQIRDEKAWVAQVRKIVEQYNQKVKRVLSDIEKTKGEVKVLFKKKKQIENLKIQRQLEKKLKDATKDLKTLKSALDHVKNKASEFAKTKNDIKKTIISIHTQLAKLKGVKDPKKLRAIARKLSRDD
jgi:uncharacterized protein YukE